MPALTNSSDGLLLVPSAILVPDELRLDVGSVPTGMIPLEGRPMLEHLADAYGDFDLDRVVAVGEAAESIWTHVDRSNYDWDVVEVSSSSSLGETVLSALNAYDEGELREQPLYINFADTLILPIRRITDRSVICYQNQNRTYRWTTFEIKAGNITNPTGKNKRTDGSPRPCFTGQFGLGNAERFRQALEGTPIEIDYELDYFYRGLLNYLESTSYELYEPNSWLDVGHLDTYHRAKKRFLNAREFNELESSSKNVITKRSDDVETLINEVRWYQNIPTELQPYLPRIYNYSTDSSDAYVEMEYIGYPALSDLHLYGAHRQHIWDDVFHRLFDMYREFQSFTVDASAKAIEEALEAMYLQKTRRRLNELRENGRFSEFFDADTVHVNGVKYPSINSILNQLEDVVEGSGLLRCQSLSIIHGDLCLPNILYDPRNEILKLIDPRGKFGSFDIYGDPRYDLAKLRHSVVGHYEHLINGRFEANVDPEVTELTYEIYTTPEQDERESRFDSILSVETDADVENIKLIEALLFLSMVPLHSDSFERQQCMLSQGIEKFAPYIS